MSLRPRSVSPSKCASALQHDLRLDVDLDLVRHEDTARLERHVPRQPEVAATELAVGRERRARSAPRILPLTPELHVERDRARDAADREVARELELVLRPRDVGAPERHLRVVLDVEEVW